MSKLPPEKALFDNMVNDVVSDVCASVDLEPPENDEILLTEHGLPSLQMATLVVALESRVGFEFTNEELTLPHWRSPARIKAMLAQHA